MDDSVKRIKQNGQKVLGPYTISNKLLGKGCYGEVYLAVKDNNKQKKCAAKMINISKLSEKQIQYLVRECESLQILSKENNPHIIKLYSQVKSSNNLYLFLELCLDGDLESYMKDKKNQNGMSEEEAVLFFRHAIEGFKSLQKNNIIHRDIKPANILLKDFVAKIADFGFSRRLEAQYLDDPQSLSTPGTPLYQAPQVFKKTLFILNQFIQLLEKTRFSSKCDVWSLGIMLYEMLYGKTPWNAKTEIQLNRNIKTVPLTFPEKPHRSKEIKQLIRQMLQFEEKDRISFQELFNHKIITDKFYYLDKNSSQNQNNNNNNVNGILQQAQESLNYKQNNKISSYLNEIQEFGEIPEEKAPCLTISQICCQDNDIDLQKQKQLNNLNQFMLYNRNIVMFYNYVQQKFIGCFNQLVNESNNQILTNEIFYKMLLVLTKNMTDFMKEAKQLLTGEAPSQIFSQQVWSAYKNTVEHFKFEQMILKDEENIQSLSQEIKNKCLQIVIEQNPENQIFYQILNDAVDKLNLRILNVQQISNFFSKITPQIKNVDTQLLVLSKLLIISINYTKEFGIWNSKFDFQLFYEQLEKESPENLQEQCLQMII